MNQYNTGQLQQQDFVRNNAEETLLTIQQIEPHPLEAIFAAALTQATKGKGTRHGGDVTPFLEQPWAHYYELHGRGFLTGQAAKKLEEAASMRNGPEFVEEALGAIVYMAMAILKEKEKLVK